MCIAYAHLLSLTRRILPQLSCGSTSCRGDERGTLRNLQVGPLARECLQKGLASRNSISILPYKVGTCPNIIQSSHAIHNYRVSSMIPQWIGLLWLFLFCRKESHNFRRSAISYNCIAIPLFPFLHITHAQGIKRQNLPPDCYRNYTVSYLFG